jgi:acetyl esterase
MSPFRTSAAKQAASLPSTAAGAPILEPTTLRFVDALAAASGPPLYMLTLQAAYKVLSDAQAGTDVHFTASALLLKVSATK